MRVTKRPAFQFYPNDWMSHAALRMCSIQARGLWMDMMCIMHGCDPYGHLMVFGKQMNADMLAKRVGESPAVVAELMMELEQLGMFAFTEDGTVYSPRMVRDEATRNSRAEGGKKGGSYGIKGKPYGVKGGRPKNPPSRGDIKTPPFRAEDEEEREEEVEGGYQGRNNSFDAFHDEDGPFR